MKTITWTEQKRETNKRQCIWVAEGEVSRRLCIRGFSCTSCEFDQTMTDFPMTGEPADHAYRKAA